MFVFLFFLSPSFTSPSLSSSCFYLVFLFLFCNFNCFCLLYPFPPSLASYYLVFLFLFRTSYFSSVHSSLPPFPILLLSNLSVLIICLCSSSIVHLLPFIFCLYFLFIPFSAFSPQVSLITQHKKSPTLIHSPLRLSTYPLPLPSGSLRPLLPLSFLLLVPLQLSTRNVHGIFIRCVIFSLLVCVESGESCGSCPLVVCHVHLPDLNVSIPPSPRRYVS